MRNGLTWQCGVAMLLLFVGGVAQDASRRVRRSPLKVSSSTRSRPAAGRDSDGSSTATCGATRTAATDEGRTIRHPGIAARGRYNIKVEIAGFATEVRENLVFNAGQNAVLNFSLKLSTVQETDHRRRRHADRADDLVGSVEHDRSNGVREPAGQGAQLLPPADARLQRRRQPAPARTPCNVGGQEVWNFGTYVDGTNNHSKWLTLQRAPQLGSSGFAIETVKEVQLITNQFSAEFGGHSAGVASMITKSGTNSSTARRS